MSNVVLLSNLALDDAATAGQTSSVGEPSLACNGSEVFVTGNWYATKTTDDGSSWSYVSPYTLLPPAAGGFCCDQTVMFNPARNLLVWLLQYSRQDATNVLRIAVKDGGTLGDDAWHWWDLAPAAVNPAWSSEWFDYNHAALSENFLYVATNVFNGNAWTRSVVFRLPLNVMQERGQLSYEYFESTTNFSLRCTQGARDTMYFVSHVDTRTVRLFSWPEASASVTQADVNVAPWQAGRYVATGPDGTNWLARCDPRITAAWVARGVIGFMWSANRKPPQRPMPYVRVVRLAEATRAIIDQPDLWNDKYAYAYPDTCPSGDGVVGVTVFRGGGSRHPGHLVGFWDDATGAWVLKGTRDSTHGPSDDKWGDYLSCRPNAPDGSSWIAAGYTLQGGSTQTSIEPRVVRFGIGNGGPPPVVATGTKPNGGSSRPAKAS